METTMLIPGVTEFAGPCYGAPCEFCGLRVRGVVYKKRVVRWTTGGKQPMKHIAFYYSHITCEAQS